MKKETVTTILFYLLFLTLVVSFAYMLIENTRLTVINHRLESEVDKIRNELVDSQNQAFGYKWQLYQLSNPENDYVGSEDE